MKSLNDAIDQKDKQIGKHYQDKISAELRVDEALSENAMLKAANQELTEQLTAANAEIDCSLQESRSPLPSAADLLNTLKGKFPRSKVSLRDIETILELLKL